MDRAYPTTEEIAEFFQSALVWCNQPTDVERAYRLELAMDCMKVYPDGIDIMLRIVNGFAPYFYRPWARPLA